MHLLFDLIVSAALVGVAIADRTFYVYNKCAFTVWPAIYSDGSNAAVPTAPTGWELASGAWTSFSVPNSWTSGRIWGRTDCDFNGANAHLPASCTTGGCNGGLLCDKSTGTGVPPASLAEFTLSGTGLDWYDVSLVDGFNLPISIETNKGCVSSVCANNITASCPSQLTHEGGGCMSACKAGIDSDPNNSPNCCTGSHSQPQTCPSSGVSFYSTWKDACPDAYIYAYDDNSALKNCSSTLSSDYLITFCPLGGSSGSSNSTGSTNSTSGSGVSSTGGSNSTNSSTNSASGATGSGTATTNTASAATNSQSGASSAGDVPSSTGAGLATGGIATGASTGGQSNPTAGASSATVRPSPAAA